MANRCVTHVRITGQEEALDLLQALTRGPDTNLDFQAVCPGPANLTLRWGGDVEDAHAITDWRAGRAAALERMLRYPWVRAAGVTDAEGLIRLLERRYQDRQGTPTATLEGLITLLAENRARYGAETLTAWRLTHWGVTGPCGEGECVRTHPGELQFRFVTGNDMPRGILAAVSRREGVTRVDAATHDFEWPAMHTAVWRQGTLVRGRSDEGEGVARAPEELWHRTLTPL